MDAARLSALLEIIERDTLALWWSGLTPAFRLGAAAMQGNHAGRDAARGGAGLGLRAAGLRLLVVGAGRLVEHRGEIVAIVGESGCGKSVTSLAIMGLLPDLATVAQGKIQFQGHYLNEMKKDDIRRMRGRKINRSCK